MPDWRSLLKRYMAFMLVKEGTTHTIKLDDMVGFTPEERKLLHDLGEEVFAEADARRGRR